MAPLLDEWLKPLSNFKHKKPPTQAHWPGDLKCTVITLYMPQCATEKRKSEYTRPVFLLLCPKTLCKFCSALSLTNSLGNTWVRCVPGAACAINNMQPCFICDKNLRNLYKRLRTHWPVHRAFCMFNDNKVHSDVSTEKKGHTQLGHCSWRGGLECAKPH